MRLRPDRKGGRENWLLIKSRDGFAEAKVEASLLGDKVAASPAAAPWPRSRDGKPAADERPAETQAAAASAGRPLPEPVEPQLATLVDAGTGRGRLAARDQV